jgi:hypothetical protein
MHISEVEKARLEKDHKMKHGYQIHDNKRDPLNVDVTQHQPVYPDMENKHARASTDNDYKGSY